MRKKPEFGRNDAIAKAVDRIEARAEAEIEDLYSRALMDAMRGNKKAMRQLQRILDGEIKPPVYCITHGQKDRWLDKQVRAIVKREKLQDRLTQCEMDASEKAAQIIQKMSEEIYRTAYSMTMEALRGKNS